MSRGSKGFTLIEALVAITLVGVGMTAVFRGFSAMSDAQYRARESERMQRLAIRKYDELIATEQIDETGLRGDFSDQDLPEYSWEADVEASGVENLNSVAVTVRKGNADDGPSARVEGLVYRPPVTTGAGAAQ